MSAKPHVVDTLSTDQGEVLAWRLERLRTAGFDVGRARELAGDCRYDLHALIELVEQGCPPHLAARILAPLLADGRPC